MASTSSVFVEAFFIGPLLPPPLMSTGFVFVPPAAAAGFIFDAPPPDAALISRLSTENVIFCLDLTAAAAAHSLAAAAAAAAAGTVAATAVWVERLTDRDLDLGLS